jgi:hypothetical protein
MPTVSSTDIIGKQTLVDESHCSSQVISHHAQRDNVTLLERRGETHLVGHLVNAALEGVRLEVARDAL